MDKHTLKIRGINLTLLLLVVRSLIYLYSFWIPSKQTYQR